ncbi:hypothetical protein HYO65_gp260 [Tenacibaculum phage PTm1]|nr:hypothetical protein HYO65_gp260 [Tenacibaculum phage PTm1]BBI90652.1 hypothetical protein [Tenacibaculum phage PTm1]
MHTLVYDAVKNEIYESQMHDLRDPNSVIFVKYEQLVQWLLHGAVPNQVKNAIQRFVKINEESNIDNSVAVIEDVHTANNEAIQDHAKNKPMLRNKLKRMKRDELISIANKRSVDLEHTGRLTKQVIMDKIINKMVIDEEF